MNIFDLFNARGREGGLTVEGIRVPAIQREYVQGRKNASGEKARHDFLPRIVDAARTDSSVAEKKNLHFVYGLIDAEDSFFMPLDGQQRLTTLFLLAWSNGDVKSMWRFEYESRRAATSFLRELSAHPRVHGDTAEGVSLVSAICDSDWFMPVWKKDETVAGMLVMLDAIDELGVECGDLDLRKVTFEVKVIDTSDSSFGQIFLKMNARGKPLTAWENIKAILDANISNGIERTCGFGKLYRESWKRQIDGEWCEKIWSVCGKDISLLNAAYDRVVRVAYACVAGRAMNSQGYEIDKWLKESGETERLEFYDSISAGLDALASHCDVLKSYWCKNRRENLLWGGGGVDETVIKWITSSVGGHEEYGLVLRFYFISLSIKHSGVDLRRIRILLNLLDATKVKSIPEEVVGGYHVMAAAGRKFLTGEGAFEELSGFDAFQMDDEKSKWDKCEANAVVEIEKSDVVHLGSTKFVPASLYADADGLNDWVKKVSARITNAELDFFCDILSALKTTDKDRHHYCGAVHIPHGDSLQKWGVEILDKDDCAEAVSVVLRGSVPVQTPLWVKHFRELCEIENGPLKSLGRLRNYGDWMYAVKLTNKTDVAVRFDRTEVDRHNRKELFAVHCFTYGTWLRKGIDGKFYQVESDGWISQTPPPAFDDKGNALTSVTGV